MKRIILFVIMLLGFIVFLNSFFIIPEGRQAIITQFGEIIGRPIKEAGPHWKVPFIQKVHLYEKRILEWDGEPASLPTRDKKFIFVDATARWQINDPIKFYKRVRTLRGAIDRLNDIIDAAVRDRVSLYPLIEVVRSSNHITELAANTALPSLSQPSEGQGVEKDKELVISLSEEVLVSIKKGQSSILQEVVSQVQKKIDELELGITVLDVRIKGLNYDSQEVRRRVYERMIAERRRIASLYLSEGRGKKAEIMGQMQKKLREIRSQAYETAQTKRGEAEGEATRIYAEAYSQDPDFFAFLRAMDTLKNTVGANQNLFISTDSPLYGYFKGLQGQKSQK